jgi:endonuclease/exonuclease/phosphatase family metal-dependent hydrolase
MEAGKENRTLSLLTYNIHSGSQTGSYRDYLTKGWKQILPHRHQMHNLDAIGDFLEKFEFVGLQEVDGGSLRSGFVNQTRYLADRSGFPYWFAEPNRNMGQLAKHSNGLLTRYPPSKCQHRRLPGVPGRGILIAEYDYGAEILAIIVVHLALGGNSQRRQVEYIRKIADQYPYSIILGDFNRSADSELMKRLFDAGYRDSCPEALTFPSWKPRRKIDYILVSGGLEVCSSGVVEYYLSDHLPIQLKVILPDTVTLQG